MLLNWTIPTNTEIDRLLRKQSDYYWKDCPSSIDKEQVFAKLKGTDGVYFTYADEGKDGAQPDWNVYPMRSLIYVNTKNQVKHIWKSELYEQYCSCFKQFLNFDLFMKTHTTTLSKFVTRSPSS